MLLAEARLNKMPTISYCSAASSTVEGQRLGTSETCDRDGHGARRTLAPIFARLT